MTDETATTATATELPKAYRPSEVEGDVYERWLAAEGVRPGGGGGCRLGGGGGGGRLPPRGRGIAGGGRRRAVHDHPAAAERHRVAAPGPRPASDGRGPPDPARQDDGASGLVPARARPRLDRGAVRPRRDPCSRRREPTEPGSRALSRADAAIRRRDTRGDPRPAAAARRVGRLGAPAVHD